MVILTRTPVEDGLTGTSLNEVLAIFSSTFRRFVIRLSLYFQGQQKSLNMKRQKVDSTESSFLRWTRALVLWQGCQLVFLVHRG